MFKFDIKCLISHLLHLSVSRLPQSSSLLHSLSNDVWLRCGLIAGLTDGVEERCTVTMRRKPGLVTVCWWEKPVHKVVFNGYKFSCCVCSCVAKPERVKEGLCKTASAGHEWASVRAAIWREVKRAPLFSCERLTCRICVKLTSAVVSPLLSVSVKNRRKTVCWRCTTLIWLDLQQLAMNIYRGSYSVRPVQEYFLFDLSTPTRVHEEEQLQ